MNVNNETERWLSEIVSGQMTLWLRNSVWPNDIPAEDRTWDLRIRSLARYAGFIDTMQGSIYGHIKSKILKQVLAA